MGKRETFAGGMATLGSAFNRAVEKTLLDGYWIALESLTESEMGSAFARALTESKFMPVPSELLGFAGKYRNLTAESATAWAAVRAAIRTHDYTVASIDFGPLVNTVLRCMGPWEWLCEQSDDDMVWRQKDFERFYVAFAGGPEAALRPEPLTGWGAGRVGCANVRISIDGKPLPLALPPAPNPVSDIVRELADSKSKTAKVLGSATLHGESASPPRDTKPKAPPMTEADIEARKADIRAQMAARGVTLPESVEATS